MVRAPVTEAPVELAAVLEHLQWRRFKLPDGVTKPDLGLDKKALKARFSRDTLDGCSSFLMHASDEWLEADFRSRLDDTWRTALGPADDLERLRYLSIRVAADLMRAAGVGP